MQFSFYYEKAPFLYHRDGWLFLGAGGEKTDEEGWQESTYYCYAEGAYDAGTYLSETGYRQDGEAHESRYNQSQNIAQNFFAHINFCWFVYFSSSGAMSL